MGWFIAGIGLAIAFDAFSWEWFGGLVMLCGVSVAMHEKVRHLAKDTRP